MTTKSLCTEVGIRDWNPDSSLIPIPKFAMIGVESESFRDRDGIEIPNADLCLCQILTVRSKKNFYDAACLQTMSFFLEHCHREIFFPRLLHSVVEKQRRTNLKEKWKRTKMGNICTKGVEPEENEETEDMEQSSKKSVAQRRGKLMLVILILNQLVQKRKISLNRFIYNLAKSVDVYTNWPKFNRGN